MAKLTRRQLQYLELLATHPSATERELARRMGCAYSTYCKHASEARRRIGAASKTEAAVKYLRGEIKSP